ncbi:glutathione hydrolase 1 proenzyme-like [Gigantopelta aegis]|uniref:glutathione hydrolase 1 proenzyme-like n=1 Tax=Gigantopelta aegis TaxID=1735272 RepID=UPI001B88C0B8|nr:glutathione hydrolase 1 proenzyme-like [Gigantopelta aegis]
MDGLARAQGDQIQLIDTDAKSKLPKSVSSDSPSDEPVGAELSSLHAAQTPTSSKKKILGTKSFSLRIIIILNVVFAVCITVPLILTIYLLPPQIGSTGAVATDVPVCSEVGLDILKKGGNAVDAAIAAMFCLSVVHPHNSGFGGGGFMLVHDHKVQKSKAYDFRETAPAAATSDMFPDKQSVYYSGKSVATPGWLKGLWQVQKNEGKLAWESLIEPAIDIANNGFNVTADLAKVLRTKVDVSGFPPLLKKWFVPGGQLVKEGDWITLEELGTTLQAVAEGGPQVFYNGQLTDSIVSAISKAAGVMTADDLHSYSIVTRDVITTSFQKSIVATMPAPSSGPALLLMLNILDGYNWTKKEVNKSLTYQHMVEAFKFAYAQRTLLGDPEFSKAMSNISDVLISKGFANKLRSKINNSSHPSSYYGPDLEPVFDKGTTHLSVVDSEEIMVSATATLNLFFGSQIITDGGIILNNEMADFSIPKFNAAPGSQPYPNNLIAPGKRPLSSMVPTVVYSKRSPCSLRMVVGASNGTRIITGVAETIMNAFVFGLNLTESIERPRLHNMWHPNHTEYENYTEVVDGVEMKKLFPPHIVSDLMKLGQTMMPVSEGLCAVQAVMKNNDNIYAHSDSRKHGKAAWFGP